MDVELRLWVYDKFATRCNVTLGADVKIGPGRKTKGHVYNYTRLLAKSQKNSRLFRGDCEIWAGANLGPENSHHCAGFMQVVSAIRRHFAGKLLTKSATFSAIRRLLSRSRVWLEFMNSIMSSCWHCSKS